MKKFLFLAILGAALSSNAQTLDIDGVTILTNFYGHRMSLDGTQIVGESEDGGTVYYNVKDNQYYYYSNCTFGRGYSVSDNGMVVGCELLDSDEQSTVAVIMSQGKTTVPTVFKSYITSDIHSITPDASRVCGVVGNSGPGMMNLPFYADMDDNGNISELKFLPTPEKDFFGNRPMYCTATWISEDGSVIAGQVVEARGFFVYPIIYRQNEQGIWSYSLPSEALFNQDNLPLPDALGDFDEEYPETPYPEVTDFMDASEIANWNKAYNIWETNNFAEELSPYNNLGEFMTNEQIEAYYNAVEQYNANVEDYNQKNEKYWEQVNNIVESSVFFVRNNMALSPDGNWLASAGEWEDFSNDLFDQPLYYFVPYQFNLQTGEIKKLAKENANLGVNQVLNSGDVICVTPASSALPPRSWLYENNSDSLIAIEEYVKSVDPFYGDWLTENLSGDIPVAEDESGNLVYEFATVTGLVSANQDMTAMAGGVLGYAIGLDMYLTYLFTDMTAGVEALTADRNFDGVYHVFNLQGVKMLETRDFSKINSLPHGIYIVNGKKLLKYAN